MKASELKVGDRFRFPRKRKFQKVIKIVPLGDGDNIPTQHKNNILVIVEGCNQYTIPPGYEVEIETKHHEGNN